MDCQQKQIGKPYLNIHQQLQLTQHSLKMVSISSIRRRGLHNWIIIEALAKLGNPIARIKAIHSSRTAALTNSDLAGGLEPVILLAKGAKVMLTSNILWQQVGLCNNGITGVIKDILYAQDQNPPSFVATYRSYYVLISISRPWTHAPINIFVATFCKILYVTCNQYCTFLSSEEKFHVSIHKYEWAIIHVYTIEFSQQSKLTCIGYHTQ